MSDPVRPPAPLVLTTSETAGALRVCRSTVYRMIASGDIHAVTIGRVLRIPYTEIVRITAAAK